ncbi:MAG: hypothetical protein JO081_13875, partial [Alphaproteobacteria bacterium]|nr:hypothetical protein [Alphaproteobacteria bacterium]
FAERFRAAVAYYPACGVVPLPTFTAPVLILIGEADDWTPVDYRTELRNLKGACLRPKVCATPGERLRLALGDGRSGAAVDGSLQARLGVSICASLRSAQMKITAAVVPVRSAPFEIETLDLAAPLADEVRAARVSDQGSCQSGNRAPVRGLWHGTDLPIKGSRRASVT